LSGDKLIGLKYRVAGSSVIARWLPPGFQKGIDNDAVDSAVDTPYDIPNFQVEYVRVEPPAVRTGFWRGVGPNNNVFAIECFMDELARKVNKDSIAFRRDMLGKTPRIQHVLDLVAEKSNWGQPLPARVGRGVSVQPTFNTSIATVVEAEVDTGGDVYIRRVTLAVGLRPRHQSGHCRRAGRGRHDFRADRRIVWRDHVREGPRSAVEFP